MALVMMVEEWGGPTYKRGETVMVPSGPPIAITKYTVTATQSHTLNASTRMLVLTATGAAGYAELGTVATGANANPTLAAGDAALLIPNGGYRAFFVNGSTKIALWDGAT